MDPGFDLVLSRDFTFCVFLFIYLAPLWLTPVSMKNNELTATETMPLKLAGWSLEEQSGHRSCPSAMFCFHRGRLKQTLPTGGHELHYTVANVRLRVTLLSLKTKGPRKEKRKNELQIREENREQEWEASAQPQKSRGPWIWLIARRASSCYFCSEWLYGSLR